MHNLASTTETAVCDAGRDVSLIAAAGVGASVAGGGWTTGRATSSRGAGDSGFGGSGSSRATGAAAGVAGAAVGTGGASLVPDVDANHAIIATMMREAASPIHSKCPRPEVIDAGAARSDERTAAAAGRVFGTAACDTGRGLGVAGGFGDGRATEADGGRGATEAGAGGGAIGAGGGVTSNVLPVAAQKSRRFWPLVRTSGSSGASFALAIAYARRYDASASFGLPMRSNTMPRLLSVLARSG